MVVVNNGYFALTESTKLRADAGFENSSSFFRDYLRKFYMLDITPGESPREGSGLETIISLRRSQASDNSNAYTLLVSPRKIEIRSGSDTGIFYGIQTLLQLLPVEKTAEKAGVLLIPSVEVTDAPRFNYRGIHLDVARHFFDTAYLKKFIDLLALHKFNKFHWHLTDDQGWRMEVNKYPNLTVTGSCRDQTLLGRFGSDIYDGKSHCGFYTIEEMKGLVNYAASRYITIIPEIDMPGHTTAALASYPFLGCTKGPYKVSQTWGVHKEVMCAGNDSTYAFIKEVLKEVAGIFPSTLIHIGGDEVPKDRWKACPVCQACMKNEGLKNEDELQSYFINRVNSLVKELGKTMIGWDEILEGKDVPGTVIMNWRGRKFAEEALRLGHPVIFSPDNPMYLNFQQSRNEDSVTQGGYNPLENVYDYDPIKPNTSNELVLGMQANLWTEYISNTAKLEYMALPRLSAVAEAAWSSNAVKDFSHFEKRLPEMMARYRMWGFNFSDAHFGLQHETVSLGDSAIGWKLISRTKGKIFYWSEGEKSETEYDRPIPISETKKIFALLKDSSGRQIGNVAGSVLEVNKATGKKVALRNPPNSMYGGRGGFTLVDGIQNNMGMVKSGQFLGFIGNDLDATIDLRFKQPINSITLHAFEQKASWIYAPLSVEFFVSNDGKNFQPVISKIYREGVKDLTYRIAVNKKARYVKVVAKNQGTIPAGMEGAGKRSWLFIDEIEVK